MKFGRSSETQGFLSSVSISIVAMPAAFVVVLMTSVASRTDGMEAASLLFTAPLIGQVVVQPMVARCMRSISVRDQAAILMLVRSLTAISGLYLTFKLSSIESALLPFHYLCYAVWTVLSIMDQPLAIRLNLFNCRYYGFSVLRSNSIGNLLGRGSLALAPVALLYASSHWYILLSLITMSSLLSLYAPWFTFRNKVFGGLHQGPAQMVRQSLWSGRKPSWALWFVLFQFLANASIGAIGFILLSAPAYANLAPPPYSVLYGGFFVVQVLLILKIVQLDTYASPQTVRNLLLLISLTTIAFGLSGHIVPILICTLALGICYSALLPLMAETMAHKIESERLAETMTLARSVGRVGSVLSIWCAGWALGNDIPSTIVLMIFGVLGILSVAGIALLERCIYKNLQ